MSVSKREFKRYVSKRSSSLLCLIYAVIILFFSLLLTTSPAKDFSPTENRTLSTLPSFSIEALASGELSKAFSNFCADQFPFRTRLFQLSSVSEICLGKLETKNVMPSKDSFLIKRKEYDEKDIKKLKENLSVIDKLKQFADDNGSSALFFCVPRPTDVLKSYCHPLFESDERVWKYVKSDVSINDMLSKKAEKGEYVFYKTDHHWTSTGAYYAYCSLGDALGFTPYPLSFFDKQTVSDNFYGTTYSACLLPHVTPDTINVFRYHGDDAITVTDLYTKEKGGLYDYDALDGVSQYDLFLGGNKAHVKVESGKPPLILIKDSYANSLIPFLALHFDIDVIDTRYLRSPLMPLLQKLCSENEAPPLLVLFGIDTLSGSIGLENVE